MAALFGAQGAAHNLRDPARAADGRRRRRPDQIGRRRTGPDNDDADAGEATPEPDQRDQGRRDDIHPPVDPRARMDGRAGTGQDGRREGEPDRRPGQTGRHAGRGSWPARMTEARLPRAGGPPGRGDVAMRGSGQGRAVRRPPCASAADAAPERPRRRASRGRGRRDDRPPGPTDQGVVRRRADPAVRRHLCRAATLPLNAAPPTCAGDPRHSG